jgi:hypothetical protein
MVIDWPIGGTKNFMEVGVEVFYHPGQAADETMSVLLDLPN